MSKYTDPAPERRCHFIPEDRPAGSIRSHRERRTGHTAEED